VSKKMHLWMLMSFTRVTEVWFLHYAVVSL
jgi:hypothetical protein